MTRYCGIKRKFNVTLFRVRQNSIKMDDYYYKILGITKSATDEDIKKAYKTLALRYHPDKNNSPKSTQIFMEITKAYQVLLNGRADVTHPEARSSADCDQAPLEELLTGCTKKVQIKRIVMTHYGQSRRRVDEIFTINVKPGLKTGTKIIFRMKSGQDSVGARDTVFVIREKPHPLFKRDGSDIKYIVKVTPQEALSGCSVTVPTLTLETISFRMDKIELDSIKRLRGQGMPSMKEPGKRGDLIVGFAINSRNVLP